MSFRTSSSKARAHESTLPIEDFAKGLTRLLSRRRKSAGAKTFKLEEPDDASVIPAIPQQSSLEYLVGISPTRSASFTTSSASVRSSQAPIEDWIGAIPQRKPIPARNPNRPSTSSTMASFQRSIYIPQTAYSPSPVVPPSLKADWESEIGTEPGSPAPAYQQRLNELVDGSSRIRVGPRAPFRDISSLSSEQDLSGPVDLTDTTKEVIIQEEIDFPVAMMGVDSMSLRSIFFASSNASEGRRRSLSSASSKSAILAPLSIGAGSPRPRPISIASSRMSFMNAYEFAIEDDVEEFQSREQEDAVQIDVATRETINITESSNDQEIMDAKQQALTVDNPLATESTEELLISQKYAAVIQELSARNSMSSDCHFSARPLISPPSSDEHFFSNRPVSPATSNISIEQDYIADDEKPTHDSNDTGIDEDYTSSEDEEAQTHALPILTSSRDLSTQKDGEIVISTSEIPADSLASILLEVASSSPYTSENSEAEPEPESKLQTSIIAGDADSSIYPLPPYHTSAMSREEEEAFSHLKISSLAASCPPPTHRAIEGMRRRIRPARHYKLINGVIVEYEPWRAPGALDLARYSPPSSTEGSISRGEEGQGGWSRVTVTA